MARKQLTEALDESIKKLEEKVMRYGDLYHAACEELKEARAKREAITHDALIAAFTKSTKTYEEVMAFLEEGMEATETEEQPKRRKRRRKQE